MMTLTALAMNPNLTVEQFRELAEEHMKAKERAWKIINEKLDEMDPAIAVQYLNAMLSIMLTW